MLSSAGPQVNYNEDSLVLPNIEPSLRAKVTQRENYTAFIMHVDCRGPQIHCHVVLFELVHALPFPQKCHFVANHIPSINC